MYRTFLVSASQRSGEAGYVSDLLEGRSHNLPVQLTSFIGREQEISAVCALLRRREVRLLTLTGTGGIGKTRLSLQVATDLRDDFADGVCFVPLAPINEPGLVMPTIAQTLGLREAEDLPLFDHLQASLRDQCLLLVLDSFEQVMEAAPKLGELLAACPELNILVTSRVVLHLRGEHEFPVAPLALPDLTHLPDSAALSHYAAVDLFIQRAQAIKPDFQITESNARTIAEICVRLDGLPLAIELAATRIKLLPPQALLARLGQRLDLLTSEAQDVPLRQQTLRNTIAWSYELLTVQEQRLFRRLAVFVGGCTLAAAEEIGITLGGVGVHVLDRVASLLDKSLLQQTQQDSDEPRLVMLETISAYGLECLANHEELETTRRVHADYCLALAQEAESRLEGPQQLVWLERLEREHENLRAALGWLEESAEAADAETALRLAGALWRFWWTRGHWSEGRNFLERALTKRERVVASMGARARAKALYGTGVLACSQGDIDVAATFCQESLALFRELGDIQGTAASLYKLGQIAWVKNNLPAARSLLEEAVALFRQVNDASGIADSLMILGCLYLDQGEYVQTQAMVEESLALYKKAGNMVGMIFSLVTLASLSLLQNELARAQTQAQECLVLSRKVGDRWSIGRCLIVLAYVAFAQGEYATACTHAEEALVLFKAMGARESIALSLHALGCGVFGQGNYVTARTLYEESLALAVALGHKEFLSIFPVGLAGAAAAQGVMEASPVGMQWAAQLLGASEAFRETFGMPLPSVVDAMHIPLVMALRVQLGEEVFAATWSEGRVMTVAQAITAQGRSTKLKQVFVEGPSLPPPSSYPAGLTAREVEVLYWVATGLTNIQIGDKMIISPRTVSTHLRSIYNKLGIATRSAAARFATEHQLV